MSNPSVNERVLSRLRTLVPGAEENLVDHQGELRARIEARQLKRVMGRISSDAVLGTAVLSDLAVFPRREREGRVEILYRLGWPEWQCRAMVRVSVPGARGPVDSVTGIWPAADWLEREAWDLYGIEFEGHPDLRRILLPADASGHPLAPAEPGPGPESSR